METELTFRPHHFLCALCFRGKGYSPTFITNFTAIMQALNAQDCDSKKIKIVKHTDSICAPCPHKRSEGCTSEAKISVLDAAHTQALSLENLTILTWQEAKALIKQKLNLNTFHKICDTCEWKQLGICETVLKEFLEG